jgi:hypothetical protein
VVRPQPACWDWPFEKPTERAATWARRDEVVAWQAGRCAICAKPEMPLVEDHDHYTGLTRGWLCSSCNAREGRSDGFVVRCYRNDNPASLWLMDWPYADPWSSGLNEDAIYALTSGQLTPEQIKAGVRLPSDIWKTAKAINLGL